MSKCPEELKELLKVVYNLSGSEVEVLYYLCGKSKERVEDIANSLNRDRSTIQRILNKLLSIDLITRKSETYSGKKKGRYYIYSMTNKDELKKKIKGRLEGWKNEKIKVLKSI